MLEIKDSKGCVSNVELPIKVEDVYAFYIPTAFSPNGDGINEEFGPKGIKYEFQSYEMLIFDRWGNRIYYTTDPNETWNGRVNNTGDVVAPNGCYVWKITLTDVIQRVPHQYVGQVTIIK